MLKYELIGENDYIFGIKECISENRGLENIEELLNLDSSVEKDWKNLINIKKAVECIAKHIENKSNFFIIVDEDADGYSSAAIIYQYIKQHDDEINIKWYVHEEKVHGIKGVKIPPGTDIVIVPDSSSDEFEEHKKIKEKNIDIVVIDHHVIERGESPYAIIVNPQLGGDNNLSLSAAGVVYKVCKGLDDYFWTDFADNYLDLVALGNIADSMSMKEKETRYYVNKGLSEINNDFFRALINKQKYSLNGKLNPTSIGFLISPLINAVTRIGSVKDRIDMFKSFIGIKELVNYKPRGKDEILVPLVDDMARRCVNIKSKQNRIKEKISCDVKEIIHKYKLNNNKMIIVRYPNMQKGMSGLIANNIAQEYKRPSAVLSGDNNGTLSGSARGYDKSGFRNLKNVVLDTGFFEMAKGHLSAFGLEIKESNFDNAIISLNKYLQSVDFEKNVIDFLIPFESMNKYIIQEICSLEDVWGKEVEEPLLMIKEIELKKCNINLIGSKEDTITIAYNDVTYIMFKKDTNTYNQILNAQKLNIIGKAKINKYKEYVNHQICIDEYEII